MEPRQSEKSMESRDEGQASPTRHPERKRRFQIIKLEERIAPHQGGVTGHAGSCNSHCGGPTGGC